MAFGVFLEPMADTLGWSRAGISSASTLAFLWMSVGGFLWGWLSDRHGVRKVVFLGGLLQGTAFVTEQQQQRENLHQCFHKTHDGRAAMQSLRGRNRIFTNA